MLRWLCVGLLLIVLSVNQNVAGQENGYIDSAVTVIGYDETTNQYCIYDTWDNNTHWYTWRGMGAGSE